MVAVVSSPGVARREEARHRDAWRPLLVPPVPPVPLLPAVRPARLPASTYRRRRAVAAGLVVALVLALSAALGVLGGGPLPVPEQPEPANRVGTVYIVQPGDTFWSIASELHPNADPRPLVDRMVAAHRGPVLHVGERITVPAR